MSLLFPLPDTPADVLRADLVDFLATPASHPRVMVEPWHDPIVQDRLNAQDAKARSRRFDDKAVITGYGEFA
jgi:hypothetical protein